MHPQQKAATGNKVGAAGIVEIQHPTDKRIPEAPQAFLNARAITEALEGKWHGKHGLACCPAHDDYNPSLSITDGDGKVLYKCHAGCSQDAVVDALRKLDLHHGKGNGHAALPHTERLVCTYKYETAVGEPAFFVDRIHLVNDKGERLGKKFSQWRKIGNYGCVHGITEGTYEQRHNGEWFRLNGKSRGRDERNFPAITPVPYRLPELLASSGMVLIAGGEKNVEDLRALGFTATCNHGGEGKWYPELTPYLKDRDVVIFRDNDKAGERHQAEVGAALNGVAKSIRVVWFPELGPKKDVSDFIESHRSLGDNEYLKRLILKRIEYSAQEWSSSNSSFVEDEWPELDEAAYYGLAGDVVKTIEPETEIRPCRNPCPVSSRRWQHYRAQLRLRHWGHLALSESIRDAGRR